MPRTIAIHQPNYLPWLGYFYKIYAADEFVFHDDVQFTSRSPIRRTWIRSAKRSLEKSYLIVPLQKHSDYALIKDLEIDHQQPWVSKQLNQVRNTYSGAPRFDFVFPFLQELLEQAGRFRLLADWNIFLIQEICCRLSIQVRFHRSAVLPVKGRGALYNLHLVQHLGGQIYLSGAGGRKYQQNDTYSAEGITLEYSDMFTFLENRPYFQAQGPFLNGLSVIDALFNIGEEGILQLFEQHAAQGDHS